MTTIIDGSASATFAIALPVAQGGSGGTTSATAAASLAAIQLQTAVVTTSGTSIDFTGIPAGVKRITMMLNNVSTNGISNIQLQTGSGSIQTASYDSYSSNGANNNGQIVTGAWIATGVTAAATYRGKVVLNSMANNLWEIDSLVASSNNYTLIGGSTVTLSGTLDRVRLTTVNGTDAFDAGSVNISWEF